MIYRYKAEKKPEWERVFAWTPKPIGVYPLKDGQQMVWLEWVERKWLDCRGRNRYEYRLPKD